jgi:hypothetical protein
MAIPVATPFELIATKFVVLPAETDAHVTWELISLEPPSLYTPTAESWRFSASPINEVEGAI